MTIRPIEGRDVDAAGEMTFVAFYDVAVRHGMRPGIGTPADSRGYVRHLLALDPLGGLVAEEHGVVVGLAWVHVRGPVATIGPLAVAPWRQRRGIGRALLDRVTAVAGSRVTQTRLVHDAFNHAALGLYLGAGFRIVAPLLDLERASLAPPGTPPCPEGVVARAAVPGDRQRVVERDARAFGAPRPQNVDLYLDVGRVVVAERSGLLVGYALGFEGPGVVHLGSAAGDAPEIVLHLLGRLGAELARAGTPTRVLVSATDRRIVDALLADGYRVFRVCQYLVRGPGVAPPPGYVLMNGDMM